MGQYFMCDYLKCFHQLNCQRSRSFTQTFTQPQYNILSLCFGKDITTVMVYVHKRWLTREIRQEASGMDPVFISDKKYNLSIMHRHLAFTWNVVGAGSKDDRKGQEERQRRGKRRWWGAAKGKTNSGGKINGKEEGEGAKGRLQRLKTRRSEYLD